MSATALLAQPLDLGLGVGDALLADLVRRPLGARHDVAGLAASLGQDGLALVGRRLAVAPGGVGVLEPLLDALAALVQLPPTGLRTTRQTMKKKTRKLSALTTTQNS